MCCALAALPGAVRLWHALTDILGLPFEAAAIGALRRRFMTTACWQAPVPQMQFHVLSFEGPDAYAQAGGIASRITGLTQALATAGFETHLWFVGDSDLPGHETRGQLHLHRWCQWISRYHPGGVYDHEEMKHNDYAASLPPFLLREMLLPHLQRGGRVVILAEEWHTVHT